MANIYYLTVPVSQKPGQSLTGCILLSWSRCHVPRLDCGLIWWLSSWGSGEDLLLNLLMWLCWHSVPHRLLNSRALLPCWLSAGGLPCRMNLSVGQLTIQQLAPFQVSKWERKRQLKNTQDRSLSIFVNLSSEVTSYHSCCILIVKSKSPMCKHHLRQEDYTRVWISISGGSLGANLTDHLTQW